MDETRERIREWNSRPVDGEGGMTRLADSEFTGALVEDDDALFLLNGRVVGTTGRPAESFTGGTAYEAPGPALPLLFAMREQGGETTTRGYTNDTPLHEVDSTLQESNFTGYVELSENVLSGDYYMVYYGGRPLYAAFVGASGETIVGDEAFERADDEVGIYEVVNASIDVSELPTGDSANAAGAGAASATGTAAGAAGVATDDTSADSEPGGEENDESASESRTEGTDTAATEATASDAAASDTTTADAAEAESAADAKEPEPDDVTDSDAPTTEPDDTATPEAGDEDESAVTDAGGAASPAETDADSADRTADASESAEPDESDEPAGSTAPGTVAGARTAGEGVRTEQPTSEQTPADPPRTRDSEKGTEPAADDTVFDAEAEWRETTSIPALDPDEAEGEPGAAEPSSAGETGSVSAEAPSASRSRSERTGRNERSEPVSEREKLVATLRERTEELETRSEQLSAAREQVEALEAEREEISAERDELAERVEELESERAELRERVEELESELERARQSGPAGTNDGDGPTLTRARALGETNLFVRYESKSKPTLESVADGATPEEVRVNLRLDEHTQFDDEHATVDGEPFRDFLRDTPEYAFVEWAVTVLPFEIRDTGHESGLADLYEALPAVDRAELGGTVEVETEEGETERHDFDVVLRDKMGDALVVADINAARDPVSGAMMTELVESATAVAEHADIGAALYVTESFFEPDALEAAENSTGGGLLSRSSKESYVRTGRKQGYHLCLAESRDGSFYVTVPEL